MQSVLAHTDNTVMMDSETLHDVYRRNAGIEHHIDSISSFRQLGGCGQETHSTAAQDARVQVQQSLVLRRRRGQLPTVLSGVLVQLGASKGQLEVAGSRGVIL